MLFTDINTIDVLTSVHAVNYVFQLFRLTQLKFNLAEKRVEKNQFLQLYSLLILIAELILMIHGIMFRHIKTSLTMVASFTNWMQLVGIRFASSTVSIESLISIKDQQLFFELIQNIDKSIENTFNFKFDHKRARLGSITYGLGMLSFYLGCEFIKIHFITTSTTSLTVPYWFQYLLPLLLIGTRYFQIYFYVSLINQRIIRVNHFLHEIKLDQVPLPVEIFNINSKSKQGYLRLVTVRELYNNLYKATKVFNRCFGISMLSILGNELFALTCNFYWTFLRYQTSIYSMEDIYKVLISIVFTLPHLFPVILLALVCHRAEHNVSKYKKAFRHDYFDHNYSQATLTSINLHKVEVDIQNAHHKTIVSKLILVI